MVHHIYEYLMSFTHWLIMYIENTMHNKVACKQGISDNNVMGK